MQHRVANSLQIIASILLLKARTGNPSNFACTCTMPPARHVGGDGATTTAGLGINESIEIWPYLSSCATA